MRTVLYEIRLLIDTHKIVRQHFLTSGSGGEVSKIAVRQRDRMCVRQRVVEKER
jgi:hypothetical protein